jgi:hypothetical protein
MCGQSLHRRSLKGRTIPAERCDPFKTTKNQDMSREQLRRRRRLNPQSELRQHVFIPLDPPTSLPCNTPYDCTLPISNPSFLACLAAHLSAIHATTDTVSPMPSSRNTTNVAYSANLLSWHRPLKLALLRLLGTLVSTGPPSCMYRHVHVWMVSRSGALRLRMWAQTTVMSVRRKEGSVVPMAIKVRRVYFSRRAS